MENKRLIINTEYFLECHGSCSGCFLSASERKSKDIFSKDLEKNIIDIISSNNINSSEQEVIVGFGRGNLLNMKDDDLATLLGLMRNIEESVKCLGFDKLVIKYEVSTSLIGKIDNMIKNAKKLIENNRNIYFNMVINSEIVSQGFWENYQIFTNNITSVRKSWGMTDNTGDILVLNINPEKLPDINLIQKYFNNKPSPINISVFPFDKSTISKNSKEYYEQKLVNLSEWLLTFWEKFKHLDLNLKNFMDSFYSSSETLGIVDIGAYHKNNVSAYFFIDKFGKITSGSLSTMGEVDYYRLIDKYSINPNIANAILVSNKSSGCFACEVKDVCIGSGAYLSMLSNYSLIGKSNICLNGYQPIFLSAKANS